MNLKKKHSPEMKAESGLGTTGDLLRRPGSVSTHSNFKAAAQQKVIPVGAVAHQCETEANHRAGHVWPRPPEGCERRIGVGINGITRI